MLLMGPTAVGKSQLALELAKSMNMEIISVDSALVYRGMDIGTAKPNCHTLQQVPHHLIDICDPAETYCVADFYTQAIQLIEAVLVRGKTPLLCGGTMLYFHAITHGLSLLPAADESVRSRLLTKAKALGWQAMHQQLSQVDSIAANRIHPNDAQRIQRALEIYHTTGVNMTKWLAAHPPQIPPYRFIQIAIGLKDRKALHQRIESRFDQMLDQGLVAEVGKLRDRADLNLDKPAMRCVGYRQIWRYLAGEYDLDRARLKAIYASRQLAKRQLTWLRANTDIHWFYTQPPQALLPRVSHFFAKACHEVCHT